MRRERMNITQVKWNDREPSFEEVKGKLMLFSWNKEKIPGVIRVETKTYFDEYDWSGVSFSILSDEPVYCEWTKDEFGVPVSPHVNDVTEYKFCYDCGLPVKVIDELKPLPLMGIEPVIVVTLGVYQCVWENNNNTIISLADTSKVRAIESWNSLVKKLTGENHG
jgi:hypothetical protein